MSAVQRKACVFLRSLTKGRAISQVIMTVMWKKFLNSWSKKRNCSTYIPNSHPNGSCQSCNQSCRISIKSPTLRWFPTWRSRRKGPKCSPTNFNLHWYVEMPLLLPSTSPCSRGSPISWGPSTPTSTRTSSSSSTRYSTAATSIRRRTSTTYCWGR